MSMLDQQPLRGLYMAIIMLITIVTLPYYILKFVIPAARPNPKWTFHQALFNTLGRSFLYHSTQLHIRTPLDFRHLGELGERVVIIYPAAASNYHGILASKPEIQPAPIPAVWYPDRPPPPQPLSSSSELVILHIHGGCFVLLDAFPADAGFAASTIQEAFGCRVLMPAYRLASDPSGSFPAALQDALTAYLYLLSSGVPAKNVVLSGDSAGANIVLGLLRYLYSTKHGNGHHIQPPGAALLWSPWLDVASARFEPGRIDSHRSAQTDYMNSAYLHWNAMAIGSEMDVQSEYLTSIGHPFECAQTKLWYQFGGCEVLFDEGLRSAHEMRGVRGNRVHIWIEEANHDIIMGGGTSCFKMEATRSAVMAKEFVTQS
ncbi:hypothetical protein MMC10_011130 [Thelotrema lepadinum]|nr:hypothetical protein [Thelotrema lepadinum]